MDTWHLYAVDWILAINKHRRDDIITSWMHTYNRIDNEWIDKRDNTQNDKKQSVSSGNIKLLHVLMQ